MHNTYYWNARYENGGEDVLIIGADSKEEAREFVSESENKHGDFVEDIYTFEEIPHVKAEKKGILEVY